MEQDVIEETAKSPAKKKVVLGENEVETRLLGTVNGYVKDYLERCQLTGTVQVFIKECKEFRLDVDESAVRSADVDGEEEIVDPTSVEAAIDMFDNAYEDAFFKLWDDHAKFPHVCDTEDYLKINFRLHIYFCCRKIKENLAPSAECMASIRDFFDREGASLSGHQEFIHYFALPFVAEPENHATFKKLFEEETWIRLRVDLEGYLNTLRVYDEAPQNKQ